jgi:hypothetical protein
MTLLLKVKQATLVHILMSIVKVVNELVAYIHTLAHGTFRFSFQVYSTASEHAQVYSTASEHEESDSVS